MSIANENEREIRKRELEEEFADLIGLPWSGRRYPGCYGIVQKYAQTRLGRALKDFSGLYTSFMNEAVAEEDGIWIARPEWGELLDMSILQKSDLLLFKVYDTEMGDEEKFKQRAPNHGGVYLGDGFLLHQLWQTESSIIDMRRGVYKRYQTCCVGIVRENTT